MPPDGRIGAIDNISIESAREKEAEMRWFYHELCGVAEVVNDAKSDPKSDFGMIFRSDRVEIRVKFTETPRIESLHVRITLGVASLDDVSDCLDDKRHKYRWHHGISGTDRLIDVLDPAGHRVHIRRVWPVF
jgi:hypothetical protein